MKGYTYVIPFYYETKDGKSGYGSTTWPAHKKIKDIKTFLAIQKQLKEMNDLQLLVALNFIKFKGKRND